MRYLTYCFLTLVLAVASVALVGCKEQVGQEPPLLLEEKVDQEPLLLLEDGNGDENPGLDTGPLADNSRCYVCHINFEVDELTSMHAKADIGCEHCHGASDAHCSDEDNITPPDIMYPAEKINSFCKSCHPDGKLGEGKKYCTDCHGEHRLSHRTRKWDKTTGKLIEDDNVRMLTDEMLEQE
ncbi:MAG: hypothetical protein WBC05_02585 [Sedimentisphaerales bacterium]